MSRHFLSACLVTTILSLVAAPPIATAIDPTSTTQNAETVLSELLAIPVHRIPKKLLADAQGVAIIPRVIKIGFVAGVRRGHGVVLTRDEEGEWSLPQFITLTGGSVGFQAGVQGSDVVLVFKTRASVENLMKGKFTIGADAAAAAGPVGRNAAAATDAQLKAEILSYSRSRGLFAGVSVDGSALEIDQAANLEFYGAPSTQVPARIPKSAALLREHLSELTGSITSKSSATTASSSTSEETSSRLEAIQRSLHQDVADLHAKLTPQWRQFLVIPAPASPASAIDQEALAATFKRYSRVNASPQYKDLTSTPEFQTALELLKEYSDALASERSTLQLPAPPKD